MERAAEEISIDEPIDARHQHEAAEHSHLGAGYPPRGSQSDGLEGLCGNPLRDEPHPATIRAVQRFGIVGLVACALGAAAARWWKSLPR